jgi:hypothetical protein
LERGHGIEAGLIFSGEEMKRGHPSEYSSAAALLSFSDRMIIVVEVFVRPLASE